MYVRHLFCVGKVKVLLLHDAYVWSETTICWCHTFFWLIKRTYKLGEAIDELAAGSVGTSVFMSA